MSRNKKSLSMHKHADWIMSQSENGEGSADIARLFNKEKRTARGPYISTPDMYGFIRMEKERRANAAKSPHPMMTRPWTLEGMGAAV